MPPIPKRAIGQSNDVLVRVTEAIKHYRDLILKRKERLAINLFDLDRVDPTIRGILLGGKLELSRANVIKVDKTKPDETAVEFTCGLLSAASICDTIRSHDMQAKESVTRVYIFRGRVWVKLGAKDLLTIVQDDSVRLNPVIFPPLPEESGPGVPLEPEAVVIGGRGPKQGAARDQGTLHSQDMDWLSPPDEELDSDIPF